MNNIKPLPLWERAIEAVGQIFVMAFVGFCRVMDNWRVIAKWVLLGAALAGFGNLTSPV